MAKHEIVSVTPPGRFEPLSEDHPAVTQEDCCAKCGTGFYPGDRVAFVRATPADEEEQWLAEHGRAHVVRCELAHESCVDHWEPEAQ